MFVTCHLELGEIIFLNLDFGRHDRGLVVKERWVFNKNLLLPLHNYRADKLPNGSTYLW